MASAQQRNDGERLERLFLAFAQTTLAQMESWATTEGVPQSLHQLVLFTEQGYRLHYQAKREYRDLLLSHYDDPLWSQKEVEQFVQKQWAVLLGSSLEEDVPVTLSSEEIKGLLYRDFFYPILDALESSGTFQPTQEQLVESYSRYQEFWATTSIHWEVTIPLLQFTSELEHPEPLGIHFKVAPFTPEEKTAVWNQGTNLDEAVRFRPVDFNTFCKTRFKLTSSHMAKRDVYGNHELQVEAEQIITALRLVKAGDVGILAFFETSQMPHTSRPPSFISILNNYSIRQPDSLYALQYGSTYTLTQADLPVVKAVYASLLQLDTWQNGLAVALQRFNQTYGRTNHEDRIIDLTIALESCLLADVSKEELNYRLALRGAALLAQTATWESEKAQALLKAMYAFRSVIVHDGRPISALGKEDRNILKKLEISPDQFPQQCENIVRDILRAYVLRLAKGETARMVCAELDRYIVQRLTTKAI